MNSRKKYKKTNKGIVFITSLGVFSKSLFLSDEFGVKELSKLYFIFAYVL